MGFCHISIDVESSTHSRRLARRYTFRYSRRRFARIALFSLARRVPLGLTLGLTSFVGLRGRSEPTRSQCPRRWDRCSSRRRGHDDDDDDHRRDKTECGLSSSEKTWLRPIRGTRGFDEASDSFTVLLITRGFLLRGTVLPT